MKRMKIPCPPNSFSPSQTHTHIHTHTSNATFVQLFQQTGASFPLFIPFAGQELCIQASAKHFPKETTSVWNWAWYLHASIQDFKKTATISFSEIMGSCPCATTEQASSHTVTIMNTRQWVGSFIFSLALNWQVRGTEQSPEYVPGEHIDLPQLLTVEQLMLTVLPSTSGLPIPLSFSSCRYTVLWIAASIKNYKIHCLENLSSAVQIQKLHCSTISESIQIQPEQ